MRAEEVMRVVPEILRLDDCRLASGKSIRRGL
jgi:hypothetical protein